MRNWANAALCSPFLTPVSLDLIRDRLLDPDAPPSGDVVDEDPQPHEWLERKQFDSAVAAFVGSLSPREQEIIFRNFWLDESQATIARGLGVSRMAVCKAIKRISHRGRIALATFGDVH